MKVHWLVKMWCLLALCPVLLAAGVQTLSIDSQLGTSIEDCFERISIGEQLPSNAIYRNVSELTTRECEQICKQDKQCQVYDYGVGAKGNATCDLSNISEKEIKEKNTLLRHPDYDVYVRRIQCEQAPPKPLQPLQDEGSGPTHRPVFRPDDDDAKRPLADDFLQDSRPFETTGADNRPHPGQRPHKPPYLNHIDRPDDYYNQKPNIDAPPSYGSHRPQDIPFRPDRPHTNYSDPYDVLQFEGPRPHPSWRPEPYYPPRPNDDIMDLYGQKPHRPNLPPYQPEKPEFVYINRPNRRPIRPHNDLGGYGNRPFDYPGKPDPYGPSDPRPPYKPSRPMDYPYRPNDRPSYDYNSQYASNYGQNQYNDNSIYLEIFDPPRPYKPNMPMSDRPGYGTSGGYGQHYGYGSQSDHGSYGGSYPNQNSHNQNSQTNNYSGSSQLDSFNKPYHTGNRPYKPIDGPSSGYGFQEPHQPEKPYDKPVSGYGTSQFQEPIGYKPSKPAYELPSLPGYGTTLPEDPIGNKPPKPANGYGNSDPQDPIGYKPTKPVNGYGTSDPQDAYKPSKPTDGSASSNYGSSQSNQFDQSYGSHSGYGPQINENPQNLYPKPEKPFYNSNKPSYGSSPGSYGSYGSYGHTPSDYSQSYGTSQSSYGGSHSSFHDYHASQQSSYGSSQYGGYQGGFDAHRPINDRPSYGRPPSYDEGPTYNRPSNYRPPYGNRPYDDNPSYDRPPYNDKPVYNKPSQDKPIYGDKPPYNEKPSYDNRPSYDNKPSYNQPSYDNNRPDGDLGPELDTDGYKNSGKVNQTGYNPDKPSHSDKPSYNSDKLNVKPVYEYELEKPNNVPSYILRPNGEVITSKPVSIGDYGDRPSHGREPTISYKESHY